MDLSQIVNGPLPKSDNSHRRGRTERQSSARNFSASSRSSRAVNPSGNGTTTMETPASRPGHSLLPAPMDTSTDAHFGGGDDGSSTSASGGGGGAPISALLRDDSRAENHSGSRARSDGKRKKCSYCGKTFYSSTHVEIHENTVHLGLKNHQCQICPARFGQSGTLTRHLRTVHEKRRDHECKEPFCGKRFSSAWSLKVHTQNVHEKLRPYLCRSPDCSRSFGNLWNRRKHERNIHGIDDPTPRKSTRR